MSNALAELAERLEVEAKFTQENGRNGGPIYDASRIIAELATVEFGSQLSIDPFDGPDIIDCIEAVTNCCKIAEGRS